MNKIEVRSNTEFSQSFCAYLQKRSFVGHQTGLKTHTHNKKKEKRNLMYLYDREMTKKLRALFYFLILLHKISDGIILNSPNLTGHVSKSGLSSFSVQSANID